jgi:hypothetical protein
MEKSKNALEEIANNEKLPLSGNRIKQDVRNNLRKNLLDLFAQELRESLGSDDIQVERVEKGVAIVLDNHVAGFIPIILDLKFVNLEDFDLEVEMETYAEKLRLQAEQKAEKEKAKAIKIEQDKARRAKAQEIRERAQS